MDYLGKHKNCLWADTSVKTVANFHVLSSRRKGKKRGFLESEAQRSMAIELALTGLRNERRELYADLAFLLGNLYL